MFSQTQTSNQLNQTSNQRYIGIVFCYMQAQKHENMGKVTLKLNTLIPEIQETFDFEIMDASYNCIGNLVIKARLGVHTINI